MGNKKPTKNDAVLRLTDEPLSVQLRVCNWIRRNLIGDSNTNSGYTSYSLKHLYESAGGDYLTNVQFNDAMEICGFYHVKSFFGSDDPEDNRVEWIYRVSSDSPAFTHIPFEKQVARRNGFFGWMMQFEGDDTPRGNLASKMKRDPDFPVPVSYECDVYDACYRYLTRKSADRDCLQAFSAAWAEYQKVRSEGDGAVHREKIQVTFEVTRRVCREFTVSAEELKAIEDGEMPYWDQLKKAAVKHGSEDCDYAVTDEHGCTIIDWDD